MTMNATERTQRDIRDRQRLGTRLYFSISPKSSENAKLMFLHRHFVNLQN